MLVKSLGRADIEFFLKRLLFLFFWLFFLWLRIQKDILMDSETRQTINLLSEHDCQTWNRRYYQNNVWIVVWNKNLCTAFSSIDEWQWQKKVKPKVFIYVLISLAGLSFLRKRSRYYDFHSIRVVVGCDWDTVIVCVQKMCHSSYILWFKYFEVQFKVPLIWKVP